MNIVERAYDFLMGRRKAYRQVFAGPVGEIVLRDLLEFCRAMQTTVGDKVWDEKVLEGRRQVWLRIQHHLQLSPDSLWKLYDGRSLDVQG